MNKQILFQPQPTLTHRADGTDSPLPSDSASSRQALMVGQLLSSSRCLSRRPGIHIGDWFISAELLVLSATLAVSIIALRRQRPY